MEAKGKMTIPCYLRCYVDSGIKKGRFEPKFKPKPNNSTVLVFDTETTTDQHQNLLFGSCGKWVNGRLEFMYLFYADDLPKKQIDVITKYGKKHNYVVLSRKDFVERIFLRNIYNARAKCVGFNLPFDLSRLAIDFTKSRKMRNGFTLKLSSDFRFPRIIIRNISSKASFIEITIPVRKKTEKDTERYRGSFVDLKTVTFALTNESYSLKTALEKFGCMKKIDTDTHGIINEKYLDYNINDTLATHELYEKCLERYVMYDLATDIAK
ncbi:MAG: hypothetical protein KC444_10465, partial [Nitrosopumilus sp.]|nr:hypothetical protein [Nitrosopumilus sp.]